MLPHLPVLPHKKTRENRRNKKQENETKEMPSLKPTTATNKAAYCFNGLSRNQAATVDPMDPVDPHRVDAVWCEVWNAEWSAERGDWSVKC